MSIVGESVSQFHSFDKPIQIGGFTVKKGNLPIDLSKLNSVLSGLPELYIFVKWILESGTEQMIE